MQDGLGERRDPFFKWMKMVANIQTEIKSNTSSSGELRTTVAPQPQSIRLSRRIAVASGRTDGSRLPEALTKSFCAFSDFTFWHYSCNFITEQGLQQVRCTRRPLPLFQDSVKMSILAYLDDSAILRGLGVQAHISWPVFISFGLHTQLCQFTVF